MIEMRTACTMEIDDAQQAVAEILEQLDLAQGLKANSVGIINCYSDAVDTGVFQAVSECLPCDCVGFTTLGLAADDVAASIMLTVSILTSDEVSFAAVATESLLEEQEQPIYEAYQRGLEQLGVDRADFMLAYLPLIGHVDGELLVNTLDRVTGGVPVFGSVAIDHNDDYHTSKVFYNGSAGNLAMSLILMSGPVSPRFYVETVPDHKIQKQKAIITRSHNNIVYEVNGMSFLEYIKTLGLSEGDGMEGAAVIPIIVDYNDGTRPVARVIYSITEDGAAVCGGAMPENATLAIGSIDYDDVAVTAEQKAREIAAVPESSGALIYPCLSRLLVLCPDMESELAAVSDILKATVPYQMAYSGGEVCPLYAAGGGTVNRFHNFTFVACLF